MWSHVWCGVCMQAKLVARVLSGKSQLPHQGQMQRDIDAFYQLLQDSSVPVRYTHDQVHHWLRRSCSHTLATVEPNADDPPHTYTLCHTDSDENCPKQGHADLCTMCSTCSVW